MDQINLWITLIQIFFFVIFTLYISFRYGVQKSISDSWYVLGQKNNWMFTLLFCYPIGLSQILHNSILFFLSGALLVLVGVATDFKSNWRITSFLHVFGAAGSIILGVSAIAVQYQFYYTAVPILIAPFIFKKNKTWWVEIVCFLSIIFSTLYLYLINM